MRKFAVLAMPLILAAPLMLLMLGIGLVGTEADSSGCITAPSTSSSTYPGVRAQEGAGQAGTGPTGTGQSGTGTDLGVMPEGVDATAGGPVNGSVLIANANIKTRDGFAQGIRAITGTTPDFITLNEVGDVPLSQMRSDTTGYDAYRDPEVIGTVDGGIRSLDNAIMWRTDTWTMLDGGRVRLVLDDQVIFDGSNKTWGRWAIWGVFQSTDGAVVSVISAHHMTNPFRYPNSQWGNQPFTRAEQYAQGMDYLVQLAGRLSSYGPVLTGGDMNSHPADGPSAAAPKMQAAGYRYTQDSGVLYNFYAPPAQVERTWELSAATVHSDHPALLTRMSMDGARPSGTPTSPTPGTQPHLGPSTGCPPCATPQIANGTTVEETSSVGTTLPPDQATAAQTAATAAFQAGFRGEDLLTSVAIAGVESSWDPRASNGSHFGLWQIARAHRGKVAGWDAPGDIFDPLLNARYAFALYQARAGSGVAKFADWIPFEQQGYRRYMNAARQAVTAAGLDTAMSSDPGTVVGIGAPRVDAAGVDTGCGTVAIVGELSSELSASVATRLQAMLRTPHGLCELSWTRGAPCTYNNQCPKVVDALYGGPGVGRGYGDGQYVAQGIIDAGLAQASGTGLDPMPPVGAVVSYNTGNGVGHVAIYVGNGRIFGNDYGCIANGVYGCVGFAGIRTPGGSVTWALPRPAFDLAGTPTATS